MRLLRWLFLDSVLGWPRAARHRSLWLDCTPLTQALFLVTKAPWSSELSHRHLCTSGFQAGQILALVSLYRYTDGSNLQSNLFLKADIETINKIGIEKLLLTLLKQVCRYHSI